MSAAMALAQNAAAMAIVVYLNQVFIFHSIFNLTIIYVFFRILGKK